MNKICPDCGGRGKIDNCGADHNGEENPCDECNDMDICNVAIDNPICKTCKGTGEINGE